MPARIRRRNRARFLRVSARPTAGKIGSRRFSGNRMRWGPRPLDTRPGTLDRGADGNRRHDPSRSHWPVRARELRLVWKIGAFGPCPGPAAGAARRSCPSLPQIGPAGCAPTEPVRGPVTVHPIASSDQADPWEPGWRASDPQPSESIARSDSPGRGRDRPGRGRDSPSADAVPGRGRDSPGRGRDRPGRGRDRPERYPGARNRSPGAIARGADAIARAPTRARLQPASSPPLTPSRTLPILPATSRRTGVDRDEYPSRVGTETRWLVETGATTAGDGPGSLRTERPPRQPWDAQ